MTVQTFPVRFAETVNRFGSSGIERRGPSASRGETVLVTVGVRSVVARAHAERVTRRGRQTLVSVNGRLTWVASGRVQVLDGAPA